ncbi:MAG: methionine--tRNA ligase [Clostridia bacterium]|nr:methionine--tRNA ligase [Clostridia bacterium]
MEKFYITTAIAYASRKPHVGNDYEIVFTDAVSRFQRKMGKDVFMLTGTDEHGQKIEEIAKEQGISPKEYVDKISSEIKENYKNLNISNDGFIRTTDPQHEKIVKKIFKKLYDQGDIYKSEYEGLYCVPCESFFTETQAPDGICPDCGRKLTKTKEESYFFKMSKYAPALIKHIEENPDFIQPPSRKNEMLNNFLLPGLSDLCVSRTSFKWGIPVDFDPKHVVYVWLDALTNYITAIGYDPDGSSETFNKYWPCDVHVIGKDILRFHTIYWPIMLMALGVPLPKKVFGHPWLLFGEDKMSKSKGNVIYSSDIIERLGVDAVRYYLLSEMPYGQDGSITYDTIIERFNTDLANTIGNLVNRTVTMVNKYFDGVLKGQNMENTDLDNELISFVSDKVAKYKTSMENLHMADACDFLLDIARRSNKYIDETMPWALAKDENSKDRLSKVLYNLIECIRILAVNIEPILPDTSAEILRQINVSENSFKSGEKFGFIQDGAKVGQAKVIFERIDKDKMLEEIAKEIEEKKAKAKEEERNLISIEDFGKVEIKAAKVLECEKVEKSKKLLKLQLSLGDEKRQVVSGIADYYSPEDLIGRTVLMVSNLKPALLCKIESQGMILAADLKDGGVKVIFADGIDEGAKIR